MSGKTLKQKIRENVSRKLKHTKNQRDRARLLAFLGNNREAEINERGSYWEMRHPGMLNIPLQTPKIH